YPFADKLFAMLLRPIQHSRWQPENVKATLIYTNPFEVFLGFCKLAFIAGLLLAMPYLLITIWRFFAPALKRNEKQVARAFVVLGSLLFALGIWFGYAVMIPVVYAFFLQYAPLDILPHFRVSEYMDVTTTLILGTAFVFQIPLLVFLLLYLQLVPAQPLIRGWRFMVIGIAIFSAIVTPADLLSMIL